MKRQPFLYFILLFTTVSLAAPEKTSPPPTAGSNFDSQGEYERGVEAVVRNKFFYKAGRIEVTGAAGVMPYDSLVNHYMVGGKLTWHLADHYGWEILDANMAFPSVTSFTSGLAQERGLSNLQATKLKQMFTTNFLLSPLYGKIRFFGSQILFFDIYFVVGGGLANTETFRLSTTGPSIAATESSVRTGMEPVFDFGIGFKIFMNQMMGIVVDLRDYVVYSEVYGKKAPKSNFSVFAGMTFFLPNF